MLVYGWLCERAKQGEKKINYCNWSSTIVIIWGVFSCVGIWRVAYSLLIKIAILTMK